MKKTLIIILKILFIVLLTLLLVTVLSPITSLLSSISTIPMLLYLFVFISSRNNAKLQFIISMEAFLKEGLTLPDAVEKSASGINFKILKKRILHEVLPQIKGGKTLSSALNGLYQNPAFLMFAVIYVINPLISLWLSPFLFKKLFTGYEQNVIAAGEKAGLLPDVFPLFYERNLEGKSKLSSSDYSVRITVITYIVIILLFVLPTFSFTTTNITPTFVNLFEGIGSKLPAATIILIFLAKTTSLALTLAAVLVILFFISLLMPAIKEQIKKVMDFFLFYFPVINKVFRYREYITFSRSMALSLGKNMPATEVMNFAADLSGNINMTKIITSIKQNLEKGKSLACAAEKEKKLPSFLKGMIYFGEKTNELILALNESADFYSDLIQDAIIKLRYQITVFFTVLIGLMVFVYVLGTFMPLIEIMRNLM